MNPMKILASLILATSLASASQIPVGSVADEQTFAARSGNQLVNTNLEAYEGKILVIMLMTPWCPFCQSNASAVGNGLLDHFNASSRGVLMGKNAHGVPIESLLLSTEEAAQWDSVNASFASSNGYDQWGIDANANRGDPRQVLGYFRGGFISSSNLYSWGNDRRRVVVLNMVRDSVTHQYREIVINQNSYTSSNDTAARAAINAIQPRSVTTPAAITTHPVSTTLNSGQSATLTVVASGDAPLTYAWFLGASGDTTHPVGSNSALFTTSPLSATTRFWVRVTNAANLTGADSTDATVTVLKPAKITASPVSASVKSGQSTTLSVLASGDGQLTYQWFEGPSGVTSTPVGTNAPTFTTPSITTTRSFWVRVFNSVSTTGADSATATISILQVTPPHAHAMSQSEGLFSISARGTQGSTFFGWDSFNEVLDRSAPIHDSTPDIGASLGDANFQTTNAEDHVIEDGNLSFNSGSLAEQITAPTAGTVGTEGYTTLILQILAVPGSGAFPADITLNPLSGVHPTVVQALNAAGDGQLWAKWDLPGNQASYTITVTGPVNQAGYHFDKVTVDTHYSATAHLPDSVAALPPSISTAANLAPHLIGMPLNQLLEATGGTAPYQFVVSAGSLPAGCSLSSTGLLTGTPTAVATSDFTVKVTDAEVLIGTKDFSLTVTTAPVITTANPIPEGNLSSSYSLTLDASGGTEPYSFTLAGGALPAGTTLSEAGIISGTPAELGTSSFTVQIQDANGFTSTKDFSLRTSDLSILTTSLPTAVRNVAFNHGLIGNGGTAPYTWSVSEGSLPAGMSLSSAGVISGTPTLSASSSTLTIRLTDSVGFSVMRQFTSGVSAVYLPPVLQPVLFPTLTIGAEFTHTLAALNYPRTYIITGLPLGLKFSASTGVITGRPRVSGLYNVQVRATNSAGSSAPVTARLVVRALDANLVGTFGGLVDRHPSVNQSLGGTFTVTTTSVGTYTLRLVGALANSKANSAATATSATGFLAATAPHINAVIAGQTLTLTFNTQEARLSGTLGSATVTGWRAAWNTAADPAEKLVGYYSMALTIAKPSDMGLVAIPQGTGFATFNVSLAGTLRLIGKTADGESITSSSFLSSKGEFWVYVPMYKKGGSVQGPLQITEDTQGHFAGNSITGVMTWLKPTMAGRTYAAAFGPLDLRVEGAYLAPASKGNIILGLPAPGRVSLNFTDAGLADSATDPDLSFGLTDDLKSDLKDAVNPGKVTFTLNPATGAVSGNFSLTETTPRSIRAKIPFRGQVVRLRDGSPKAVGYFLLPQIPTPGQAANASPILSGGFTLDQLVD